MTVETMLIETLTARVHFAIANTATVDTTLKTEIKWALHCALRELIERTEHSGFRVIGSLTTANGTKTYALPDDFHREIEEGVKFAASDYRTLTYISEQDYDSKMLDANTTTGDPYLYMIRGRNSTSAAAQMSFYPTPSSIRTIYINYLAFPVKLYDLADGTAIDKRIPPEYHHILVTGALRHLPNYVKDKWPVYNGLWEQMVMEAKKKAVQVTGQTYQRELYAPGIGAVGLGRVPSTLTGPAL